ncbi:MAG TPA: NAD(P)/FAD-dependent oxidoreductase [Candidatus Eisenbacteria bacterium]
MLIIGGGPAGLTAGMYCRMRKMTVQVVDAGRVGGQLISLYGDKPVHDWPGIHYIIANELAGHLIEHAQKLEVEMVGNQKVEDVTRPGDDAFEIVARDVVTKEEHRYRANAVIVAIGGGAFEPRRLKVPGEDGLTEESLTYRMPDRARVAGKKVVVVGGGDSGLESAQAAHEAGARVTLVQVLERFTGMESNIDLVNRMEIPRHFNTRVKEIVVGDGRVRAVRVQTKGAPEPFTIECDYLVVNVGSAVNLDAVKRWGIEVENNLIRVDRSMKTSVEGIFACGDIVTYDGKYKLLLTASSEGCVAAQSAYLHVRKPQRLTMTDLWT